MSNNQESVSETDIDHRDESMDRAVAVIRTYETARDSIKQAQTEVRAAEKALLQKRAVLNEHIAVMKAARKRLDSALAYSKPEV